MEKDKCEMCGSSGDTLSFHHLIPQTLHSKKWFEKRYDKMFMKKHGINICKNYCHRHIHHVISEKDMGTSYHTLELLMGHPEVKKYVEWRSKRVI